MKGRVELLEIRPEQLTSNDVGGEQVPSPSQCNQEASECNTFILL